MAKHASTVAPGIGAECDISIILPMRDEVEHLERQGDVARVVMNASEYGAEIISAHGDAADGAGGYARSAPDARFTRFSKQRRLVNELEGRTGNRDNL